MCVILNIDLAMRKRSGIHHHPTPLSFTLTFLMRLDNLLQLDTHRFVFPRLHICHDLVAADFELS